MNDIYEERLNERGIKPTAVRILILKAMMEQDTAFSLTTLEEDLVTIDKSTISRTINLFHDNLLIHSIDDGTGSAKYSVCRPDCMCHLNQLHVHFNCTHCKKTYCLENIAIPQVKLPQGFVLENINFVLKGLCDQCSHSATQLHE
ncbi:MAG: transcriptional repressor [Dysgonamonadaceae bacterium]